MKSFTVSALLLVPHAVAFTVHPASFNSYPMNSDKVPDEHLRAESERIQTRLREQQQRLANADSLLTATGGGAADGANLHHSVDRSQFERIIVQLAAEFVQDTTELCKKREEPECDNEINNEDLRPRGSTDAAPSLINERLPAFLKPIPSNSTRPGNGLDAAAADSSADAASEQKRLGKRQRVSRFLSAFFRGKKGQAAAEDATADDDSGAVDIDHCPSWA